MRNNVRMISLTSSRIRWLASLAVLTPIFGYVAVTAAEGIPTASPLVYSGVLEKNGLPPTQPTPISIELYAIGTGGVPLCRVDLADPVPVASKGRFRVDLGGDARCLDAVRNNRDLWIEVQAEGAPLPRAKLSASPFAVESERAASVTNNAVTTAAIANEAVTSAKLAANIALRGDLSVAGRVSGDGTAEFWSAHRTAGVYATTWTAVPGLTLTIDLDRPAVVHLRSTGVLRAPIPGDPSPNALCLQGFRYVVDGVPRGNSAYGQVLQSAAGSILWWQNWVLDSAEPLNAGSHTIVVETREAVGTSPVCHACREANGTAPDYTDCLLTATAHYQ